MKNRCAKIPQSVKDATRATVIAPIQGRSQRAEPMQMDAYGQPI